MNEVSMNELSLRKVCIHVSVWNAYSCWQWVHGPAGLVCGVTHVQWPCAPLPELLLPYSCEFFQRTGCFLTWWSLYDGSAGGGVHKDSFCQTISMSASMYTDRHLKVWDLPSSLLISLWMAGLSTECGHWCTVGSHQISQVLCISRWEFPWCIDVVHICRNVCVCELHGAIAACTHSSMDYGHWHMETLLRKWPGGHLFHAHALSTDKKYGHMEAQLLKAVFCTCISVVVQI